MRLSASGPLRPFGAGVLALGVALVTAGMVVAPAGAVVNRRPGRRVPACVTGQTADVPGGAVRVGGGARVTLVASAVPRGASPSGASGASVPGGRTAAPGSRRRTTATALRRRTTASTSHGRTTAAALRRRTTATAEGRQLASIDQHVVPWVTLGGSLLAVGILLFLVDLRRRGSSGGRR